MENNNDEIRKKSEELDKKIKDSKEELEVLQKKCKHEKYSIKQITSENGTPMTGLYKVCDFCKKTIGYPSQQDLKDAGFKSS